MTCARQDRCKHGDKCFVASDYDVTRCTAFKSKVQTNEEWFCQLPTKEKAKWLSRHSQFMYECGQKQVAPKIMYEEDWEWWLKQPHTTIKE